MLRCEPNGNVYAAHAFATKGQIKMTYAERSTSAPPSDPYASSSKAPVADAPKENLASKGAAAFRDAKASAASVISDTGNYAGQKGQEALDNVRVVGGSLAVAIEESVATRPYNPRAGCGGWVPVWGDLASFEITSQGEWSWAVV
jgi:hypothetical protein